jgi:hypothetical protein
VHHDGRGWRALRATRRSLRAPAEPGRHVQVTLAPRHLRKSNLAPLLARRPDGIFVSDFEQGEIGPDLYRKACEFGLEGLVSKHKTAAIAPARQRTGSR